MWPPKKGIEGHAHNTARQQWRQALVRMQTESPMTQWKILVLKQLLLQKYLHLKPHTRTPTSETPELVASQIASRDEATDLTQLWWSWGKIITIPERVDKRYVIIPIGTDGERSPCNETENEHIEGRIAKLEGKSQFPNTVFTIKREPNQQEHTTTDSHGLHWKPSSPTISFLWKITTTDRKEWKREWCLNVVGCGSEWKQ